MLVAILDLANDLLQIHVGEALFVGFDDLLVSPIRRSASQWPLCITFRSCQAASTSTLLFNRPGLTQGIVKFTRLTKDMSLTRVAFHQESKL